MGNQCSPCEQHNTPAGVEYEIWPEQVTPTRRNELPRLRLGQRDEHGVQERHLVASSQKSPCLVGDDSAAQLPGKSSLAVASETVEFEEPSVPSVEIVFEDSSGSKQKVLIQQRPLGANFSKLPFGPTKISYVKPQSYAVSLGLQVDWIVIAVNGEDMMKKTFEETQAEMTSHMEKLPLRLPHTSDDGEKGITLV